MTPVCSAGACTVATSSQSEVCTRTVPNRTGCGTPWHGCCGGTCVDFRTNDSHCGACNVDCGALGSTCESVADRGYACGCGGSGTPSCQSLLWEQATCYPFGGQTLCDCQCPTLVGDTVCAGGGCGPGFYCWDCNGGHNVCAPTSGACGS